MTISIIDGRYQKIYLIAGVIEKIPPIISKWIFPYRPGPWATPGMEKAKKPH